MSALGLSDDMIYGEVLGPKVGSAAVAIPALLTVKGLLDVFRSLNLICFDNFLTFKS